MSDKAVKALCGTTLMIAGLVGLHLHIEYSGWVMFVGFLVL